MKPGDIVQGDDGGRFLVGKRVAYRGKPGCTDPRCTRSDSYPDTCFGWHCERCDAPCGMMGHDCPEDAD